MLERLKDGIEVTYKENEKTDNKNKKRYNAIKDKFSDIRVNKNKFVDFIQRKDLHGGNNKVLEEVKNIDFSNANPRNNSFMNELTFAGQAITEGFFEVFNIEQNKAIEKYKDQLQIIEQRSNTGENRYFIGTFNGNNLKRLTKYKDRKEDLQTQLDRQEELSKSKQSEQQHTQTLEREKDN